MKPTPPKDKKQVKAYPLATLRDIFNLPSRQQMRTCLEEITECLLQARDANDLMMTHTQGTKAVEWPDVIEWIDDDEREVTTTYEGTDIQLHRKIEDPKPQPIHTAPEEGLFLIYLPATNFWWPASRLTDETIASFAHGRINAPYSIKATHWLPMPGSPKPPNNNVCHANMRP